MAFKEYRTGKPIKTLNDMLIFATDYNPIPQSTPPTLEYRNISVGSLFSLGLSDLEDTTILEFGENSMMILALSLLENVILYSSTGGELYLTSHLRYYDKIVNQEARGDMLTNLLFDSFGDRKISRKFYKYINWTGDIDDYKTFYDIYERSIVTSAYKYGIKYAGYLKTLHEEFNPLWNVDGTETTTRTLEQDGTITNAKRGGDTTQETTSGTDSKTGTVADAKTGNDSRHITGTDTDANSGVDTSTRSRTTTEGATFYDAEKETTNNGKTVTTTHNTTDAMTYNNTNTTTHNTTDTIAKSVNTGVTYNSDATTTRDLLDTERITLTRQGNIGVISTVKLLQEFRDFYNVDLFTAITKDIAYDLTEGVY